MKMKAIRNTFYKGGIFLGAIGMASQVFAAAGDHFSTNSQSLVDVISNLQIYLTLIEELIVGAAVVAFLYGVVKYIFSGGDEESRQEGVKFITYGLVGLTVIVTLWGLVHIVASIFGVQVSKGVPELTP